MGAELQIVLKAAQLIGFIVLLVLLSWILRRCTPTLERWLQALIAKPSAPDPPPLRIHLEPLPNGAKWRDPARVEQLAAALRSMGFQDAGQFTIWEMPEARIWGWANPETAVYAAICDHSEQPTWLDLVCDYEDGTSFQYSNTTAPALLDRPPYVTSVRVPDAEAQWIYEKLVSERPSGTLRPVDADAFTREFEKAWTDWIEWRHARGGTNERELRAIAEHSQLQVTDERYAALQKNSEYESRLALIELIKHRFEEQGLPPDIDEQSWGQMRPHVIVVHDLMDVEAAADLAGGWRSWLDRRTQADLASLQPLPPRELFARINQRLPERRRFKHLGQVTKPIEADLYLPA